MSVDQVRIIDRHLQVLPRLVVGAADQLAGVVELKVGEVGPGRSGQVEHRHVGGDERQRCAGLAVLGERHRPLHHLPQVGRPRRGLPGEGAVEEHQRARTHRQRLADRQLGDQATVVEQVIVALDRRQKTGHRRAGEERRLGRTRIESDGGAGVDVGGHRSERHLEVVDVDDRQVGIDELGQTLVGVQMGLVEPKRADRLPRRTGKDLLLGDRGPDVRKPVGAPCRVGGQERPVESTDRRPDDQVRRHAVLGQRLQHAHLGSSQAGAAPHDEGDRAGQVQAAVAVGVGVAVRRSGVGARG